MRQKFILPMGIIMCLILNSCEPESLPKTNENAVQKSIHFQANSGNEEVPIDKKEEDDDD